MESNKTNQSEKAEKSIKDDQTKVYVERKIQKVIEMKQEIDKILEDIPSVVAKGFEDHKYVLDCQFLPKLINAQDKVRSLDQQLKKEVQQRDNKNEIKALQDQIDAYSKSILRMKDKENEY